MHPRTREILEYLDTPHAALVRTVAAVPPELRERQPAPERWSVAQVLEHLAIVEQRITVLLTGLIDSARAAGLGAEQETTPVAHTLDFARILDRTRPVVASDAARPRAGLSADAAAAALAEQHEAFRAFVLSADGLALAEVSAPHPVFGPLNVYQWMIFVGGHEARHTAQIHEIAATLADTTREG